ncbi:MAG: SET domain-containing protein [Planctomycetota bacterium]|nr:SET domain-containing protein [Planctomycetota bacterium]
MPTKRAPRPADALPAVHVRDSGIHGRGLFAGQDIPKNALILRIEGRATQRNGTYVIWSESERGEPEGFLITNDARFVNHATRPNAAFYDHDLWSLRAIRKGEEITHHYGADWDARA